jgi:hypothetical protein
MPTDPTRVCSIQPRLARIRRLDGKKPAAFSLAVSDAARRKLQPASRVDDAVGRRKHDSYNESAAGIGMDAAEIGDR